MRAATAAAPKRTCWTAKVSSSPENEEVRSLARNQRSVARSILTMMLNVCGTVGALSGSTTRTWRSPSSRVKPPGKYALSNFLGLMLSLPAAGGHSVVFIRAMRPESSSSDCQPHVVLTCDEQVQVACSEVKLRASFVSAKIVSCRSATIAFSVAIPMQKISLFFTLHTAHQSFRTLAGGGGSWYQGRSAGIFISLGRSTLRAKALWSCGRYEALFAMT